MKRDCTCPRARHQHGTAAGYSVCGCKCFPCRVAYAQQVRDRRSGKRGPETERTWPYVPATGTVRRIQALHALGWSGKELGERLGVTLQYVYKLRTESPRIMPATAHRVAELYDALWDQQPPTETRGERHAATYARTAAKRHGWVPPLAWDDDTIDDPDAKPYRPLYRERLDGIDEIAIEEAARGRHVRLTPAERNEAVRRLTEHGYTARQIADRLRTTNRSVVRRRARTAA